jgi:putative transcriptional regulator
MKKPFASSQSERRIPMKLKDMVSVVHNPGDPLIKTDTDWAAVDALTEEQLHAAALSDPDSQPVPRGTDEELTKLGLHRIPNVKKLRERLGLTQEVFAATYRIPIGTLRDWEQRRKLPDAPARAYLTVIERDPEAVAGLLVDAA